MNKYMNRIFAALIGFAAAASLSSCEVEEATVYDGCELGAEKKHFEVTAEAGSVDVDVWSNTAYRIRPLNRADWASYPATCSGTDGFTVVYEENTEFPRMATLCLAVDEERQYDTVYIKQAGVKVPELKIVDAGVAVAGSPEGVAAANPVKVPFETNIPADEIEHTLVYTEGDGGWIHNLEFTDEGILVFDVDANPSETEVRKASVALSFIDGWDNKVESVCYITQANAADKTGTEQTFGQVRALGTEDGYRIGSNIIIEGFVVSDPASGNMGDNEQMTTSYIDYNVCKKTVYLESIDGKYGFMLRTSTVEDNVFKRYDRVKLCLNGAVIYRRNDPEHYDIRNVTSSMIVSLQSGTASDIPVKSMHIDQLKDDDIYTYVKLEDCELPVRKGPMTPLNEGYTNAGGANRTAKAAILLRDINGDDMYVYTNTTCPYRRTGKRLPYGAGPMSGIIVHELYTRFAYADNDSGNDETYGNIGRYQIRHVSYDDFGMKDDFNDGFSALLTEFRYLANERPMQMSPTYGSNGSLAHTYRYANTGTTAILGITDYSYLGPVGTNANYFFGQHYGNENGLGIILEDGTDWKADDKTINNSPSKHRGKGQVPAAVGSAWYAWYNWNNAADKPYYWVVEVSTRNVRTDVLSLQVSMLNYVSSGKFGPRYYNVEWSRTGLDNDWEFIERISVPDVIQWTPASQLWQSAGFKPINVSLPLDMLGYDVVYLRICPASKGGGTLLEYYVDNAEDSWTMPWSGMNYLAIRYNKQ